MNKDKDDSEKYKKFWNNPDKYIPINNIGDLYYQWFGERYAALRMIKNKPIFNRAYDLLTERKNFSRKNAFGEMHCDGYLWIEKHPEIKVIIEERQSYKYIFIDTGTEFHIRDLYYKWNYPRSRNIDLKGITVKRFREQEFKCECPQEIDKRFNAFCYGDGRDVGYILSMDYWLRGYEKAKNIVPQTLFAIESIHYWKYYLENQNELE